MHCRLAYAALIREASLPEEFAEFMTIFIIRQGYVITGLKNPRQ
jgi:hypothetical protein